MWRNIGLLLAVLFSIGFLVFSEIPLGVPSEWVWLRQVLPVDAPEAIDRLSVPLLTGALLFFFCRLADQRFANLGTIGRTASLCLLTLGGVAWLGAARHAAPSPHREVRPLWILYDKYASGYFFEAAFRTTSQHELLSTYEARMARGDVLHEGTHPPGLFLLNFWALQAAGRSPTLANLAQSAVSSETTRLFRTMESEARMARPLSQTELGALCLVSFVSTFLCIATLWPVYGIVNLLANPRTAWRAASLVMTIPSLAVFAPRSDVVYAFSATMLLWLILKAVLSQSLTLRIFFAVLAGFAMTVCLTVSLAHLPVLVAAGLCCLLLPYGSCGASLKPVVLANVVMIITFGTLAVGWSLTTDCNLFNVWRMNLLNHAAFYDQSPRTWWKWMLVNPLELCFSVGFPLTVVCSISLVRMIRSLVNKVPLVSEKLAIAHRLSFALLMTWVTLWVSGKNMGEAARLWCFLTPWFVIVASLSLALPEGSDSRRNNELHSDSQNVYDSSGWHLLLVCQLIVCAATTGRVTGYLELV